MLNKEQKLERFIDEYLENTGEYPGRQELREFLASIDDEPDYPRSLYQPNYYNQHNHLRDASDDLLNEVKQVFSKISISSKKAITKAARNDNVSEASYLIAAFILKMALYYVLKGSHEKGFENVSNI